VPETANTTLGLIEFKSRATILANLAAFPELDIEYAATHDPGINESVLKSYLELM
ncbi:hypothetical protein HDU98_009274, partial [Podochytrium sp. JEL0797]